uniref:Uncharacterized protein n=1 Tax=Cacopsylla melanoneura TaxID=428564 RepID=A0A8D8Y4V7_9HEMI
MRRPRKSSRLIKSNFQTLQSHVRCTLTSVLKRKLMILFKYFNFSGKDPHPIQIIAEHSCRHTASSRRHYEDSRRDLQPVWITRSFPRLPRSRDSCDGGLFFPAHIVYPVQILF